MPDMDHHTILVDRQGRALIPKSMRDAIGLGDGGEAIAWLEGHRLVLEPRKGLLGQLKARFRSVEGSMSEELIGERREGASREDQG